MFDLGQGVYPDGKLPDEISQLFNKAENFHQADHHFLLQEITKAQKDTLKATNETTHVPPNIIAQITQKQYIIIAADTHRQDVSNLIRQILEGQEHIKIPAGAAVWDEGTHNVDLLTSDNLKRAINAQLPDEKTLPSIKINGLQLPAGTQENRNAGDLINLYHAVRLAVQDFKPKDNAPPTLVHNTLG